MAENSQSAEIEALIRRSGASRRELKAAYTVLRHKLDVPARVKGSLRAHPFGWFGGSLATGLLASFFVPKGNGHKPARDHKPEAPRKARGGLGGFALTAVTSMAKPLLKTWLSNRLRGTSSGLQNALVRRRFSFAKDK